jgi:hypothetical protein
MRLFASVTVMDTGVFMKHLREMMSRLDSKDASVRTCTGVLWSKCSNQAPGNHNGTSETLTGGSGSWPGEINPSYANKVRITA